MKKKLAGALILFCAGFCLSVYAEKAVVKKKVSVTGSRAKSDTVGVLYKNAKVDILEKKGNLAKIKTECWVPLSALKILPQPQVKLETNYGDITLKLFPDKAPNTVINFMKLVKKGFYNNTIFHRVIPNFMIQGGDPLGTGQGGPGYRFADEFSDLKFNKKGLLAMANAGPNTNGSQFFITVALTPWLNNHHTIFGEVISGYNVVEKISKAQKDARNKPVKDIVIKKAVILKESQWADKDLMLIK